MATIIFFADHNEEALLASLKLASQLRREQNNVFYIGVSDSERRIAEYGLSFFPIYESAAVNVGQSDRADTARIQERRTALLKLFLSGNELDILIEHAKPDFVFLPSYLALEGGLLVLRYRLLVSFLRSGPRAEPRLAAVRRACQEVLDDPVFGAGTSNYLATRLSGKVELQDIAEEICTMPEYVLGRDAFQGENSYLDESGNLLNGDVNLTEFFLGRQISSKAYDRDGTEAW